LVTEELGHPGGHDRLPLYVRPESGDDAPDRRLVDAAASLELDLASRKRPRFG
jgi:hypothetical protein